MAGDLYGPLPLTGRWAVGASVRSVRCCEGCGG